MHNRVADWDDCRAEQCTKLYTTDSINVNFCSAEVSIKNTEVLTTNITHTKHIHQKYWNISVALEHDTIWQ